MSYVRGRSLQERLADASCPEALTGCFLWQADVGGARYGQIWANGKQGYAHRVAWELANGPIPKGTIVRHRCDTPVCVNPDHLELGTMRDNTADMMSRRRAPLGERRSDARLTDAQVAEVRKRKEEGEGVTALSREFGVSHSLVSTICSWKKRRHG